MIGAHLYKQLKLLPFLAIFCLILPAWIFAHPGGLDSNCGHRNRKTGEYHYHKNWKSCRNKSPVKEAVPQEKQYPVSSLSITSTGNPLIDCKEHIKYGAPSQEPVLLCRTGYILSHDSKHKVPDWVAYHLTKEKIYGVHGRSNDFRADPDLPIGERSELSDYRRSGYDRGHMAPAAAMKWSAKAMSESFLLSNMAPQVGVGFNRHIWKNLEEYVREWTKQRGELYVVTGPIYGGVVQTIGANRVSVPTHFYKVIFDPAKMEVIAFILPNAKLDSGDLPTFITSIDEVEGKTGLDFLSALGDNIEKRIEAAKQLKLW